VLPLANIGIGEAIVSVAVIAFMAFLIMSRGRGG
jgi:hypothetical protein